ncbi:MAG TPA: NAD(P)-dependent oxidoreductase, partial [Bacteroidetes bacterium]|nr:NAD(P)-dependent oxidoreductase [Bacteroidota bacterium]
MRNTIFNLNEDQLKILVTGANGQLGHCLSDLAETTDWNWIITTRKHFDLTNSSDVNTFIKENKPDIIVNTAAYTQVDQAEKESELAFNVNQQGVENLIKAIEGSLTRIIHISTDYVFEGQGSNPYGETDPVDPQSVYGQSKAAGEKTLLDKISDRSYILRTSWLYS